MEFTRPKFDHRTLSLNDIVEAATAKSLKRPLTNSLKHSPARHVGVRVEVSEWEALRVTVHDDGTGFDPDQNEAGLGLGTMRDYAEVVGGTLTVQSEIGLGTTIQADLPLYLSQVASGRT